MLKGLDDFILLARNELFILEETLLVLNLSGVCGLEALPGCINSYVFASLPKCC